MLEANAEIRKQMKSSGIRIWQIADKLSCHENTVIRKLRHELPEPEKARILEAVEQIRNGQ